jgi:hypothetical protein
MVAKSPNLNPSRSNGVVVPAQAPLLAPGSLQGNAYWWMKQQRRQRNRRNGNPTPL